MTSLVLIALFVVAALQVYAFFDTRRTLQTLKNAFPDSGVCRLIVGEFLTDQMKTGQAEEIERGLQQHPNAPALQFFPEIEHPDTVSHNETWSKDYHVSVNVSLLGGDHPSQVFENVRRDINIYLLRNHNHGTDFNIIRDIAERHSETVVSEAEGKVNVPLYFGLLGTVIGVVIGAFQLGTSTISEAEDVSALLTTVGWSMSVSAIGLMLTILSNARLHNALRSMESGRNTLLAFIQSELLPVLSNDMSRSLVTLQSNLDNFNQKFNITIDKFNLSVGMVQENLKSQVRFLEKLDQIGFNHMTASVVKMFEELSGSASSFEQFRQYQRTLAHTLTTFSDSVHSLQSLLIRTKNMEEGIDETVRHFREQENTYHRILGILEDNDKFLKDRKEQVSRFISELDSYIGTQYEALQQHTSANNQRLVGALDSHESSARNAFERFSALLDQKIEAMKQAADAEIEAMEEAYRAKQPQLDHLSRLANIEKTVAMLSNQQQGRAGHQQTMIDLLGQIFGQLKILNDGAGINPKRKKPGKLRSTGNGAANTDEPEAKTTRGILSRIRKMFVRDA